MREALLLVTVLLAACTGGGWQAVAHSPTVIRGMTVDVKAQARRGASSAKVNEKGPASFIERILHQRGLVFGTDGSGKALAAYLANRHPSRPSTDARAGDIVAFDLGDGCGGRIGLVEGVEQGGRITFKEWREGAFVQGHATPADPQRRRDAKGRILNSFLRPISPDDLPGTRHFAGGMICGLFRVP